jgi:hypothetical protein
MAKPLVVQYEGQSTNFSLEKIDRTKLYGYVETEVVDEAGKTCELATLIGDGRSIVGKGGSAIAYLSHDGQWRKKADLRPVDVHGKIITPVKSTFDAPVTLDRMAAIEEYLAHNINLIYRLEAEAENPALLEALRSGAIFQFPFSYRGGVEASAGFLLLGGDGNLFLCVGTRAAIEFVGLAATAATVVDETEASSADDEDALDFSLV